jgi:hypothetical protein
LIGFIFAVLLRSIDNPKVDRPTPLSQLFFPARVTAKHLSIFLII